MFWLDVSLTEEVHSKAWVFCLDENLQDVIRGSFERVCWDTRVVLWTAMVIGCRAKA